MSKKINILGSGFSSLAAACYLAKQGNDVSVYEKNTSLGGRARQFSEEGFTFDMGPSWYWMPDVFEKFFADFDKKPSDYYRLEKLNPAYRVYFGKDNFFDVKDNVNDIIEDFEKIEKGSSKYLKDFIKSAQKNYEIAIHNLVYRPGEHIGELITPQTAMRVNQFFSNIKKDVRSKIKDQRLQQILEFPVLFLGAKPEDTPSFYNFMNFADFGLGTWQPTNGFYDVIDGMVKLAKELGVKFYTNSAVHKIKTENSKVKGILIGDTFNSCDVVLSGADYHHTETLLEEKDRQYSEKYWQKRTFAPSSLLFYVGFDKKVQNVLHHNLFFDTDFDAHAKEIYDQPVWPKEPLFYANFTSKTNKHTAPEGCENAFFLIPIATDLEDTEEIREKYFEKIITRLENLTGQTLKNHIIYKKSFCVTDFKKEYNSYGGNAYGMANTLLQTAFLRPKLKSKKVKNLYFTGQLTVPGPGVPPALISGKLVADLIKKYQNN
jgi:phytoene desaturase